MWTESTLNSSLFTMIRRVCPALNRYPLSIIRYPSLDHQYLVPCPHSTHKRKDPVKKSKKIPHKFHKKLAFFLL